MVVEQNREQPLPYLFAKLNTMKEGWEALAMRLWKKTVEVQGGRRIED